MDLGSEIHLYTTIMGWHYYNVIWTVLVGTGLVFLPLLGLIFDAVMDARKQGSMLDNDVERSMSGLEVELMKLAIVIFLAAVPTSLTTISKDSLTANKVKMGATGSTYDETYGATAFVNSNIKVPMWWYGVMAVSQGITAAVVQDTDIKTSLRDVKRGLQAASISNPKTSYYYQIHRSECFEPARTKFYDEVGAVADGTAAGIDVSWEGADYFRTTTGYYDVMRPDMLVAGFAFTSGDSKEYASDPGAGGNPTCNELWNKISDAVFAEAVDDNIIDSWKDYFGILDDEDKNTIVRSYISAEPKGTWNTADEIAWQKGGSTDNAGQAATTYVNETLIGYLLLLGAGLVDAFTSALIYASSMVQAYLLMAVYMLIPIGMLLSRYSISYLFTAGTLIFSITFWSALWMVASQADVLFSESLWSYSGRALFGQHTRPEDNIKLAMHSIVICSLYTLLPVAMTWIFTAAGSRAGAAVSDGVTKGQSAMSSGVSSGGKVAGAGAKGMKK